MSRSVRSLRWAVPLVASTVVLSACGDSELPPAPAVTVTGDAVTQTAPAVTVTPDAVTVDPPAVTETAPAVTVTGAIGDSEPEDVDPATAAGALTLLSVKGKAGTGGYDRDEFGSAWTDATSTQGSRNGCDTRNDVLRRDLSGLQVKGNTAGCVAEKGTLSDPYSGEAMSFVRGEDSASQIHIDHIVPLNNAWQTGAQQIGSEQRANFANDPLNLWAVDGSLNQSKGDGDAATWLPPNKPIRCDYVSRQVAVKAKYDLWVTTAEAEAISRVLADCPAETLPTTDQWSVPATN